MATIHGVRCNLLRDRFGDELLRAILRSLHLEYAFAYEACDADFDRDSELRTVMPFHRRGRIEQSLHRIGAESDHIVVDTVEDESGFWAHVQLIAEDVILTQSSCNEKEVPYSEARYRKALAQPYVRQMLLFPHDELEQACGDHLTVYALLLHRGLKRVPGILGSAIVRFPTESGGYFEEQLDLIEEFPEIVAEFSDSPLESNEIDEPSLPTGVGEVEEQG